MSGREWSKVSPAVWSSPRFMGLPSADAKLLLMYFMTSDHQNSSGCYRIPDGYAIADLGWDLERYRCARQALAEAELITFDPATCEVFVDRWFRHNPPTNQSHAKGAHKIICRINSDTIREKAEAEFMATEWGAKVNVHFLDQPSRYGGLANSRMVRGQS